MDVILYGDMGYLVIILLKIIFVHYLAKHNNPRDLICPLYYPTQING